MGFRVWKPLHDVISIPDIEERLYVARNVSLILEAGVWKSYSGCDGDGGHKKAIGIVVWPIVAFVCTILRWGFRVECYFVCLVMELGSGQSFRVGFLVRRRLDIHSFLARMRGFTNDQAFQKCYQLGAQSTLSRSG